MVTSVDYRSAWRDYRRRRLIAGIVVIGGLGAAWLVASAFDRGNPIRSTIAVVWLGGAAMAGLYLRLFPCPRCGRNLSNGMTSISKIPWGCSGCGLRIGQNPNEATEWEPIDDCAAKRTKR